YGIVEERTRKLSLIGNFGGMPASEFPYHAPPFCVFAMLKDAVGAGAVELTILRVETDEELVTYHGNLSFPDMFTEVRFLLRLRECWFPASGTYDFVLRVDG